MKRGQTQTIFVWIFVAVVAGLVLLFGFKMIKNITETGDDVKAVRFFQDFEQKVNEYSYLDDESQGDEQFWLPGWVEYVCVRKKINGNFDSFSSTDQSKIDDDKIKALLNDNGFQDRNVFFVPLKDTSVHMRRVDKLENSNSVCIEVYNGKLEVILKNVGGSVNVIKK